MTALRMTRIDPPARARPLARHVDPLFDALILQAITRQLPDALLQAHTLIQRDMDERPDGAAFPCKHKMTGDYYIAEHRFDTCTDPCTSEVAHHFSLMARCLEKTWHAQQTDWDYLGLEVHFTWNTVRAQLEATGDVDSSAI